jgi:hypothetical protein
MKPRPRVIIHNHLPTRDHWFRVGRVGRYDILQGAGTDGGDWMAREISGPDREVKRFKSRKEAEEHAELSSE